MRIDTVHIERYGPISGFTGKGLGDFTLIYGPNEQGKTLVIDALLKLLFKKGMSRVARHFGNIDRVTERPEGYVVIEIDGKEVKLERRQSLYDHVRLTPTDFRNIFVVRDSDLGIVGEREYYSQVSEKLTGLRLSELADIRREIQRRGRLTNPTSNSALSDSAGADHAARKVETAARLIAEVDSLVETLRASGFDRLERVLVETKERVAAAERELDLLRRAEVRERYLRAQHNLRELAAMTDKLRGYDAIDEATAESWRALEVDKKRTQSDLESARRQEAHKALKQEDLDVEHAAAADAVAGIEDRSRRFDDTVRPKIDVCKTLMRAAARTRFTGGFRKGALAASLGLFGIALVGSIVTQTVFFYAMSAVLCLATATAAVLVFVHQRTHAELQGAIKEARRAASAFGQHFDILDDPSWMRNPLEAELDQAYRRLRQTEVNREVFAKERIRLSAEIRERVDLLGEIEDAIAALQRRSGVPDLETYRATLVAKRDDIAKRRSLEGLVKTELGTPRAGEDAVAFWQTEITGRLAALPEEEAEVPVDPERMTVLTTRLRADKNKAEHIADTLDAGRRDLRDLELKIDHSRILRGHDVACRTSADLEALKRVLQEFTDGVDTLKDDAHTALEILERIEQEERSRVIELFGATRSVSRHFREMTGGLYDAVRFDPDRTEISVSHRDGDAVAAAKLSGGAFDQLYLSIRLSIAEALLGEQRGFFVLDDPFIKADIHRLKKQMAILRKVTRSGWQVLYFSAKKEVLDALEDDIKGGRVGLIRLEDRAVFREPPSVPKDVTLTQSDLFTDPPTY